ncbi:MAG: hypothetical protein PVF58_12640 [Candidatus Methanofastidiosia archaeon]|jgi:hypothetical protein
MIKKAGVIIFIILVGILITQHLEKFKEFFNSIDKFLEYLDSMPPSYQYLLFLGIIVGVLILYLGGALPHRGRWYT